MGVASWQITIAFFIITACHVDIRGPAPHSAALTPTRISRWHSSAIGGNAIAYAMWFEIVRAGEAVTATLGILGIPVIGVVSTDADHRRAPDRWPISIGFALIFAASACALLARSLPASEGGRRYWLTFCASSAMRADHRLGRIGKRLDDGEVVAGKFRIARFAPLLPPCVGDGPALPLELTRFRDRRRRHQASGRARPARTAAKGGAPLRRRAEGPG